MFYHSLGILGKSWVTGSDNPRGGGYNHSRLEPCLLPVAVQNGSFNPEPTATAHADRRLPYLADNAFIELEVDTLARRNRCTPSPLAPG